MSSLFANIPNTLKHRASRPRLNWRPSRKTMWRVASLAMFAMHLPATIKVFGAITADGAAVAWSSLVLLAASNLFFLFEAIFAWSWRILSDRRCLFAFVLIVALMHAGVIDRVMPDVLPDHGTTYWMILATASLTVISLSLAVSRISGRFDRLTDFGRILAAFRSEYSRREIVVLRIPKSSPHRRALSLRAPPLD